MSLSGCTNANLRRSLVSDIQPDCSQPAQVALHWIPQHCRLQGQQRQRCKLLERWKLCFLISSVAALIGSFTANLFKFLSFSPSQSIQASAFLYSSWTHLKNMRNTEMSWYQWYCKNVLMLNKIKIQIYAGNSPEIIAERIISPH